MPMSIRGRMPMSIRGRMLMSIRGCPRLNIQFILQAQDQQVPRVQSQRRRLGAAPQHIAKPPRTCGLSLISNVHIDVQGAVFAAQVLGLWHERAWRRSGAYLRERCGSGTDRPTRCEHQRQEYA